MGDEDPYPRIDEMLLDALARDFPDTLPMISMGSDPTSVAMDLSRLNGHQDVLRRLRRVYEQQREA